MSSMPISGSASPSSLVATSSAVDAGSRTWASFVVSQFNFVATLGPIALLLFCGWGLCRWIDSRTSLEKFDLTQPFVGKHELNSLHIPVIHHADSTGQRTAHKAMLVLLAVMGVAAMAGAGRWMGRSLVAHWIGVAAAVAGASVYLTYWTRVPHEPKVSMYYAAGLLLVGVAGGNLLRDRWLNRAVGAAILVAFAAFHLPAFLAPFDLSTNHWDSIELYEMHFAIVSTQGERLAEGRRMFDEVFPYYGLNMGLVTAGLSRLMGGLSIRGHIQLMNVIQVLYVSLLLFGYQWAARGRWLAVLGPAALAVMMYAHGHHLRTFPNFLAFRYLGIALTPVVLILLRNQRAFAGSLGVGLLDAFCMLHNPETGIAIVVGSLAYLFFRYLAGDVLSWRRYAVVGSAYALGASLGIAAFAAAYRVSVGEWPGLDWPAKYVHTLSFIASSGYSALPFTFHPMAILVFAHSCWTLLGVARRPLGTQGFHGSFRAAVAATILVWYAYYSNRPQEEGIYANVLLYGYLLADFGRSLLVLRHSPRLLAPVLVGATAMILVYAPYAAVVGVREYPRYRAGLKEMRKTPESRIAFEGSGIYLPNDSRGQKLKEKADYLASIKSEGPIGYATVNTYLIPKLSGVWSDLPFVDTFWEAINRHQYEKLRDSMLDPSRKRVLLDSEESVAASTPVPGVKINDEYRVLLVIEQSRKYFNKLRSELSKDFVKVGVVHGWEDWRRK